MKSKIRVAPSILSADFANLERELNAITSAGADWIHVDVMDGHFVDNITIGIPVVASLKKVARLPLDVHLMIEKPEKYVEGFLKAGADYLTIHVEATADPKKVLEKIRSLGGKPGITLRPVTPVEKVLPFLPLVDLALIMTVNPGFGGQAFMADQVEKISQLRQAAIRLNKDLRVEVDGGINEQTAKTCVAAGADVLVAGSYVFKQDYQTAITKLKGV